MLEYNKGRFHVINKEENNLWFDTQTHAIYKLASDKKIEDDGFLEVANSNSDVLLQSACADGSNLAINLNLTSACNLKCTYCFAQGGDYGLCSNNMDENMLERLETILDNELTSSRKARIEFFGGEPLLNFNMIRKTVAFCKEYQSKHHIQFIYRISTNLTFLTKEIADLLCENNFIVSVSIDGDKDTHDLQRPYKDDSGSFGDIIQNVEALRLRSQELIIVARMTIAQQKIALIDNIQALIDRALFDYMSIYPASLRRQERKKSIYSYYFNDEIRRQLKDVLNKYESLFNSSNRFKGVLEYERIYDALLKRKISVNHCAGGNTYFTLSADGHITPCHRLCGNKDFYIDEQSSGRVDRGKILDWRTKADERKSCHDCWVRYICGGGCKQEHYVYSGDVHHVNTNSCEYHKYIIQSLIENMFNFSEGFNRRKIEIDDLFVYCGRPVVNA